VSLFASSLITRLRWEMRNGEELFEYYWAIIVYLREYLLRALGLLAVDGIIV
jgi:hypothetical protein